VSLQGKLHSMVSKCYVKYSILNSKNVRKRSASKFNQNTYFIKIRNTTLYRIPRNLFTSCKTRRGAVFIILRNFVSVIFNYSYLWLHLWIIINVHIMYYVLYLLLLFFFFTCSLLWYIIILLYNIYIYINCSIALQTFWFWIYYVGKLYRWNMSIIYMYRERYFLKLSDLYYVNWEGS